MALLSWNANYSVNVREIDDQHKNLVRLLNDLHDGMRVGKGKEILKPILDELVNYTVYHFNHEEKLFTSTGYPEIIKHKAEHTNLIQQVNRLKSDLESGKTVLTMEVMNFLKDWLNNHIVGSDKKYSSHLNSNGIS